MTPTAPGTWRDPTSEPLAPRGTCHPAELAAGGKRWAVALALTLLLSFSTLHGAEPGEAWQRLEPYFSSPAAWQGQLGSYTSPLKFYDGSPVENLVDWSRRRREIRERWHSRLGAWPPVLEHPSLEILSTTPREGVTQHRVRVQVAERQFLEGYLLVPEAPAPRPAVVVPYYDPETSIGQKGQLRDFAWQLSRRGFVSLSIGSPGGDARLPDRAQAECQPLSYLGYIAANAYQALADRPEVDPRRVGIVGHSYGGKWALFGSCLYDKFACAAWSDPGIVFDEARGSVNYWEPWYLGYEANRTRQPGLINSERPRTGPYAQLVAEGRDLHELHALMAPRPFLVSGGSEDFPARWQALNHAVAVNQLLGFRHRVGMTNRPAHSPTEESNEQIYQFFAHCLQAPVRGTQPIAHRGLLLESPENTLVNFRACLEAHLGFEFDVRRSRDGRLVCLHDELLERTTTGSGLVTERTWAELSALDAGSWFDPTFRGEKVPTIDEILALVAAYPASAGSYAVDLKTDDPQVEAQLVRAARAQGVLDRLLFIGRTIDVPDVRQRLLAADAASHTAVLAQTPENLSAALADTTADWAYLRFVPTAAEVAAIRAAGKKCLVAGPAVAGNLPDAWRQAAAVGVDAVLTDHALELRRQLGSAGAAERPR